MDYELTFWIIAAIAGIIAFAVLSVMAKREAQNYVEWIERGEW